MCWNNINITHPCFKHSNSVTSNHSENDDASNGNENTANNKIHQIKAIIIVKLCINKQSFPGFVSQLILYDSAFTTFQKYMSIPITSRSIHQNRRTKTYIESIEYNVRTLIIYKYNLKNLWCTINFSWKWQFWWLLLLKVRFEILFNAGIKHVRIKKYTPCNRPSQGSAQVQFSLV